jgi:hypothetical protein
LNRDFDEAVVDSSGRIYLSGSGVWGGGAIARLTPNGAVDETFGRVIGGGGTRANGLYSYSGYNAAISSAGSRLLTAGELHIDYGSLAPFVQIVARTTDDAAPSPIEMNNRVVSLTGTSHDDDVHLAGGPVFEGSDDVSVLLNGFGRLFRGRDMDQFSAIGGDGDDFFTNYLSGIPCRIAGGNGRDRIGGGDKNDTLEGGAGRDFIDGGDGADRIVGGGGNDQIRGEGGADHLYGRAGNDGIVGGGGNDYIDGGSGADRLDGGRGNDVFAAFDSTIDHVFGGAGSDTATADKDDVLDAIESATG